MSERCSLIWLSEKLGSFSRQAIPSVSITRETCLGRTYLSDFVFSVAIYLRAHTQIYIYICMYVYIYIYKLTPPTPPMIHPNLLFVSCGSWEVGNLRCENIDRDQIYSKFLKLEMRKHWQ